MASSMFPALRHDVKWYISAFCTGWLLKENVLDAKICGGLSMYPTLPFRNHRGIILRKYRLGRGIQVGDVIIYRSPIMPSSDSGKRVIGMPGDYVCADPPYSPTVGETGSMIRVPEGHVWVQGDNLPWSRDSRFSGPVPMGLIKGKFVAFTEGWGFWWTRVKGGKQALRKVEERKS